jgi:hypothetical protein
MQSGAGQAEIAHLGGSVCRNEDVVGLDVVVHEVILLEHPQRIKKLAAQVKQTGI